MRVKMSVSPEDQVKFYEWSAGVKLKLPFMPGLSSVAAGELIQVLESEELSKVEILRVLPLVEAISDKDDRNAVIILILVLDGTFVVEEVREDGSPALKVGFESLNDVAFTRFVSNEQICRKCGRDPSQFAHDVDGQGKITCPA